MKSSFPYTKILYKKKFSKGVTLYKFSSQLFIKLWCPLSKKKKIIFNVHTTFIIQIKNYEVNIDTNKELELSVQTF